MCFPDQGDILYQLCKPLENYRLFRAHFSKIKNNTLRKTKKPRIPYLVVVSRILYFRLHWEDMQNLVFWFEKIVIEKVISFSG